MSSQDMTRPISARGVIFSWVGLIICFASLCGCQCKQCIDNQLAYCEPLDNACLSSHAWLSAHWAWQHHETMCVKDDPHKRYFKHGFVDGFYNVATGGAGCLPAIPPRKYWKSCYETPEGHLKVCAYFQGYSRGVQVAYESGKSRSTRLSSSLPNYLKTSAPNCPTCPSLYDASPAMEMAPEPNGMIPPPPLMPDFLSDPAIDGPILPTGPVPDAVDFLSPPIRVDGT